MNRTTAILAVALATVALCGCARNMSDLDAYIAEVKARPGGRIEELPPPTPYKSYEYQPDGARSPFEAQEQQSAGAGSGTRPDPSRPRQYLEGFPLDTMKMVGTLRLGGQLHGLVRTADGRVHRVLTGNYLGQNDGRITEIDEIEIQLIEIIPDGLGGYTERAATLGLGEN